MPIETKCPQCQSTLRVPDSAAGRKARCPKCSTVIQVPGSAEAAQSNTGGASQGEKFYVDSSTGATYGPITKSELDDWVSQNRITATCQIRSTSGRSTSASSMYPALGGGIGAGGQAPSGGANPFKNPGATSGENPFANPAKTISSTGPGGRNPYASPTSANAANNKRRGTGEPGRVDLGTCFSYAWEVFSPNLGLLVGVAATFIPLQITDRVLQAVIENTNDSAVIIGCIVASLALMVVNVFLGIGQIRIALKLCRGQRASYGDLFSGGDRLLHTIGFSFLIAIPAVLSLFLLLLPFWPAYYLIVDRKSGVIESLSRGWKIGWPNIGQTFVLFLASIGIALLGCLMFCIGTLFTGPYLSLLFATAYLMMLGEIHPGDQRPR